MSVDEHSVTVARAGAHWRVALGLIAVNTGLYFTLILLIALNKPLLARLVVPGLSLAILLSALVTVAAWIITLVYVRWANDNENRSSL